LRKKIEEYERRERIYQKEMHEIQKEQQKEVQRLKKKFKTEKRRT